MHCILPSPSGASPRQGIARFVTLLALLLLVALLPAAPVPAPPQAHPALVRLAADRPDAMLTVIVQKTAPGQAVEDAAKRLGGMITADLRFINAFGARMPARAALELARTKGVRWVSPDSPIIHTGTRPPCSTCSTFLSAMQTLLAAYPQATGASRLWFETAGSLKGQGVTVAIVDSGINHQSDLAGSDGSGPSRVIADVVLTASGGGALTTDSWGHGTHVAGIIGGNGAASYGAQIGMAPQVNLVNVKVGNDQQGITTADVVTGLQWVYDNAARYNIRIVNLSVSSTLAESYHTSPLDAAVELLWFKGIVVVVAGGNNGQTNSGVLYPPANDPFVISVGALDDRGTPDNRDDVLAPFSAYGVTMDGINKPDLVAPGTNIISLLANTKAILAKDHPDHFVDGFAGAQDYYFRMSGTSMSSAVVAGGIALLLQDEPGLTPDQVKHRLLSTARQVTYSGAGAGVLDIYAAVKGTTTKRANKGLVASRMLWTSDAPVVWDAANWGAANWGAANWGAANWGSLSWDP
jgi:serine protease AprX